MSFGDDEYYTFKWGTRGGVYHSDIFIDILKRFGLGVNSERKAT
jgi:hypothetical protein